jgi:hypothetical protein
MKENLVQWCHQSQVGQEVDVILVDAWLFLPYVLLDVGHDNLL